MPPYDSPAQARVADQEAMAASTCVHPVQLSVAPYHVDSPAQEIRFAPWASQRAWLLEHVWRLVPSISTRSRIYACGSNAWVEYSRARHKVRVVSSTCGHRLCPACRAKKASVLAARMAMLAESASGYALKLVTLTLKHSKRDLTEQIKALKVAFRKLRADRVWKRSFASGVAIVEVTRSKTTGDWHPHLHILARCAYIPHEALKAAWWRASKTSNIVDIRLIRGGSSVAKYVSCYLTKPPDDSVLKSPELSKQWADALQNTHWVVPFGKRGSLPQLPPDEGPKDWQRIGPLEALAATGLPYRNADWALSTIIASLDSRVIALCDPDAPPGDELDL